MKRVVQILLLTSLAFPQAPATATAESAPAEEVVVPFTLAVDLSNVPSPGALIDRERSAGSDICFIVFLHVTGWSKEPFETQSEGIAYPLKLEQMSTTRYLQREPGGPIQRDWFVATAALAGAPDGATTCGWQTR
jgi:hypothetical protein